MKYSRSVSAMRMRSVCCVSQRACAGAILVASKPQVLLEGWTTLPLINHYAHAMVKTPKKPGKLFTCMYVVVCVCMYLHQVVRDGDAGETPQ